MTTRATAGHMRHRVKVMRPTETRGTRGQRKGDDRVLIPVAFASIETLTGREAEQARTVFPMATYRCELRARAGIEIQPGDYLQFGNRKIGIGHADDVDQRGIKYELLCAELK